MEAEGVVGRRLLGLNGGQWRAASGGGGAEFVKLISLFVGIRDVEVGNERARESGGGK